VMAETQLWFCHGTGSSDSTVTVDGQTLTRYEKYCPTGGTVSHFDVGYDSNDQAKADATADDMWDRGIDGVVENWEGDSNTCKAGSSPYANNAPFASPCGTTTTNVDLASQALTSAMNTRHPGMTHLVQYDDGAYKSTQCTTDGIITDDVNQPQCIENKMIADFNVLAARWFTDPNYVKVNGQPVLTFFVTETRSDGSNKFDYCTMQTPCNLTGSANTCTSATDCWTRLWDGIRANFLSHGYNPYMIFRHDHRHRQSDGGFAWVSPSDGAHSTAADQDNWGNKTSLDGWLSTESGALASGTTGANGLPLTFFAGAWKGFDDRMANWSPSWDHNTSPATPVPAAVPPGNYPRITSQRCGTNWLDTFAETGHYFTTSNQAPFLMVGTWDDYEEGTEVETGIDNCVSSFGGTRTGSTLQWTINLSGDGASERTIDHYTVWYSTDGATGEQLAQLSTVAATGTGTSASYSLDLAPYCTTLPATSVLYVQAIGKPSITNHMTDGITYTNAGCGTTPLSGRVTDLNSGGAIGGATVSLSGPTSASTTADASGNYSFSGIPAGTYTVTGTAGGYLARSYSGVTVTSGQTTTQNLQLTTTGRVTGTVTGAGGAALSGATVTLQGGNLPTTDTVTTGAAGNYTSNWDPIGTYTLTCSATGYAAQTVPGVAISTGGLTTVNCALSNTGTLTGVVTNLNSGGAISGATVSYSGGSTTTDSTGRYTFTGVVSGTYSITATASGYKARTYSGVVVTAGVTNTQNVQLTTTGRVTGTVTAGGVAVSGATITLQGGNLATTDTVTSNSTGHYTSNWDPIGTYSVTCSAPGHSTQTITGVQITSGGLTTVNCQI